MGGKGEGKIRRKEGKGWNLRIGLVGPLLVGARWKCTHDRPRTLRWKAGEEECEENAVGNKS